MARRRSTRIERIIRFCIAAIALGACSAETATSVRYRPDQCRRVTILDEMTGEAVRGAEDLALDPQRGLVYISAYDRRSVERAVRRGASILPEGGVYAVSLSTLLASAGAAPASPILRNSDIAGGLRPHGLSFNSEIDEIAFINRSYQRMNGRWEMTPRVERIGADGEVIVSGEQRAPCAANDLVNESFQTLISFDHERCDWRAGLEDALGLRRSGVVADNGDRLFDQALYANGVLRLEDGRIALAATREKALLLLDDRGDGLRVSARISLPGGPDNLSLTGDGSVIAAVHPSLLTIGLSRRLGIGVAPSRIVKIDPQSGDVDILFEDPEGALFSAATVAALWRDALIAGSVTDDGLLVCKDGR